MLELERRLYRLRTIEQLEPPFALVDAGRLLGRVDAGVIPTASRRSSASFQSRVGSEPAAALPPGRRDAT